MLKLSSLGTAKLHLVFISAQITIYPIFLLNANYTFLELKIQVSKSFYLQDTPSSLISMDNSN